MIEAIAQSFLTGCAMFGAVCAVFSGLRENLSEAHRDALLGWLSKLDSSQEPAAVLGMATNVFHEIFGRQHWSLLCVWRCTLVALAIYVATFLAWAITHFSDLLDGIVSGEGMIMFLAGPLVTVLLAFPLLGSLRLILRHPARPKPWRAVSSWLLLNALLTALLLTYVGGALFGLTSALVAGHPLKAENVLLFYPFHYMMTTIEYGLRLEAKHGFSVGVVFYSTLFTAVWPSMFIVGATIAQLAVRAFAGVAHVEQKLEGRPLGLIGVLSGLGITLTYWLASLLAWMMG